MYTIDDEELASAIPSWDLSLPTKLPCKWIAKLAFSIIPNVPMERKTDVWRHFYRPCVPTARS
jgi:hypothetical protein